MNEHEKAFIENFIIKEKRPRIKYEVDDPEKHDIALCFLNHCSIFEPRYVYWIKNTSDVIKLLKSKGVVQHKPSKKESEHIGEKDQLMETVIKVLKENGCPDKVYLISSDSDLDGKVLPLAEALYKLPYSGWGTIVSCIPGKLAFYYDEEGERRALLKRDL